MILSLYRTGYFVREAFKNLRYSPLMAGISILTIAVSLILVGFFGGLLMTADDLVGKLTGEFRVTAYLDPKLDPQTADEIAQRLKSQIELRDDVTSVEYFTADQDRKRARKLLPKDLVAQLTDENMPGQPTLEIALKKERPRRRDVEALTEYVRQLDGIDGISEVEFGMDRIRLGIAFVEVFRTLAWVICVVLLFAAVFFVVSTIKMAVHSRSQEIEILQLVGATRLFIRIPFYIEGIFQGLSGTAVAFVVTIFGHYKLNEYIREEHLLVTDNIDLMPPTLIIWFFVGGTLLGLIGSVLSVGRYLKV